MKNKKIFKINKITFDQDNVTKIEKINFNNYSLCYVRLLIGDIESTKLQTIH
jgi:hypothetical protein